MPGQTKHHLLSKGKRIVSRNRKNPFIRKLAHYSATFHRWYENLDADFYSNGEYFLLKALKKEPFKIIFDVGANVGDWTRMARLMRSLGGYREKWHTVKVGVSLNTI